MSHRILGPLAVLAATGALLAAGCGGDDETTSAATDDSTALTEDEFLSQANQICKDGNKEINQGAEDTFGGGQPSQAEIEQFGTDVLLPSIQSQIDAIRALSAPESIADDVTTFLDDAETALGEVEADPSLLAASDGDGPFADVNQQADAIGLTSCA